MLLVAGLLLISCSRGNNYQCHYEVKIGTDSFKCVGFSSSRAPFSVLVVSNGEECFSNSRIHLQKTCKSVDAKNSSCAAYINQFGMFVIWEMFLNSFVKKKLLLRGIIKKLRNDQNIMPHITYSLDLARCCNRKIKPMRCTVSK